MVTIPSLWLSILLASVLVFAASAVIHMFLGYHADDYGELPREDEVRAALRPFDLPAGDYVTPYAGSREALESEDYRRKVTEGPAAFLTVLRADDFLSMGSQLVQWFVYCLLVSLFVAYVSGRVLGPGAGYMGVFRIAGTVAFMGYGLALLQRSIWYRQAWSTTLKSVFDALIYGLLTAGAFAGF